MKSLKLAAMAAVMSLAALSGEKASAQVYYGYPAAVPASRSFAPTSPYCAFGPSNGYGGYGNAWAWPAYAPATGYPANYRPAGQYGVPAYSYPAGNYSVPVYTQPSGTYRAPVYYQPYNGAPVNRPVAPGAGHFSVEDRYTVPAATPAPQGSPLLELKGGGLPSPFYEKPATTFPTGVYAPVNSHPAQSSPTNDSPFYR